MRLPKSLYAFFAFCSFCNANADVTWEEQAERLQNVSATLLDGIPVGEPLTTQLSVEAKTIISLLPKVDPTVGGKKEKVPSSPLHTIPTLQVNARFVDSQPYAVGAQAWAGYLMPGAESLFGIDAKLSQFGFGASVVGSYVIGSGALYANLGYQHTSANLKGAITAIGAGDKFDSKTSTFYAAPGYIFNDINLWANVLVAFKSTESTFEIPADHTKFKNTDDLGDTGFPFASQISLGWRHSSGIQIGASELYVPKRLLMPRLLVSYQYDLR